MSVYRDAPTVDSSSTAKFTDIHDSASLLPPGSHATTVSKMHDSNRRKQTVDRLHAKISSTSQQLLTEQKLQQEYIEEYIDLLSKADKAQQSRLKVAFEKRHQKSAQLIISLQAKLEDYRQRLLFIEENNLELQKDTKSHGHSFKNFVMKPKEFAQQLKSKLGHTDPNINTGENKQEDSLSLQLEKNEMIRPSSASPTFTGLQHSRSTTMLSPASAGFHLFSTQHKNIQTTLHDFQSEQNALREAIASLRKQLTTDTENMRHILDTEREICDKLEEQFNDLTELHQHEISNIKQELTSLEEKLAYAMDEKTAELRDQLLNCHTRILKMELQNSQHQQQRADDKEESKFRIGTAINLLFNFIGFVLVILQTIVGILHPFISTRWRYFCTLFFVILLSIVWYKWEMVTDAFPWLKFPSSASND